MKQVLLFEANSLEQLEEKMNASIRRSNDGDEVVDVKFIPVAKESYIYYFGQITYEIK